MVFFVTCSLRRWALRGIWTAILVLGLCQAAKVHRGLVLQPSGFGPVVRQAFWTWSLCGSLSSLGLLSQVLPGCDTTNCAVPGKGSHNNTIRTLERSLLAADTDGYADTESGTSHECAVRVPKGLQRLEHYVLTHNLSQVDLSAAWTGQQRFQGSKQR